MIFKIYVDACIFILNSKVIIITYKGESILKRLKYFTILIKTRTIYL